MARARSYSPLPHGGPVLHGESPACHLDVSLSHSSDPPGAPSGDKYLCLGILSCLQTIDAWLNWMSGRVGALLVDNVPSY
jgi:hypothetical protein